MKGVRTGKSKTEIQLLLTSGDLLPQARQMLEAELSIIKDEELKCEKQNDRRSDSVRFWLGFGISTAIAITALKLRLFLFDKFVMIRLYFIRK